jgi:hypothetical protein
VLGCRHCLSAMGNALCYRFIRVANSQRCQDEWLFRGRKKRKGQMLSTVFARIIYHVNRFRSNSAADLGSRQKTRARHLRAAPVLFPITDRSRVADHLTTICTCPVMPGRNVNSVASRSIRTINVAASPTA